jgi:hypothetical protein
MMSDGFEQLFWTESVSKKINVTFQAAALQWLIGPTRL